MGRKIGSRRRTRASRSSGFSCFFWCSWRSIVIEYGLNFASNLRSNTAGFDAEQIASVKKFRDLLMELGEYAPAEQRPAPLVV